MRLRRMAGRWKAIAIAALVSLGCATPAPPRLIVVPDKAQLGGKLGMYWGGTIYVLKGLDRETEHKVINHELDHHYYGSMGELPLTDNCIWK